MLCLLSYETLPEVCYAENPYNAAQKFLQSNDLPLTYIDEVVKFIEKNTAGVNIGTGGDEYVDPFTGDLSSVHTPRIRLTFAVI